MKTKLTALFIILLFVGVPLATAQSEVPEGWHSVTYSKGSPEQVVQQCPKTKMTELCLSCHITPTFALKEADPDDLYDYPNGWTRIREIDGEKWGIYECLDVRSGPWLETVDYFNRHGIKNIIFEVHNYGGSLLDAWRIIGYMRELESSGVTIHTRMYGMALSAGFLLFISGSDGCRLVHENAEFMWHELWTFKMFSISTPEGAKDEAENLRHLQDVAQNWVLRKSNGKLDPNIFKTEVNFKEWWLSGSKMIDYGLADGYVHKVPVKCELEKSHE